MRSLNVCLGLANFVVCYYLHKTLFPRLSQGQHAARALLMHLFPLLYFYNFMYYTDVASTFFVMLCYLFALKNKLTVSAVVCIYFLLFLFMLFVFIYLLSI